MKKKIIISLICLVFLFSCGKKGDPEYKVQIGNFIKLYI